MSISFEPTIFSGLAQMQADTGDSVLNHYFLEHSWRWVSDPDYPATFWSPQFFYPAPHVLTYSENMVGVAPLYWGLRLFVSDEIAWQWWVLLVGGLNFFAMVLVLRWFDVNPVLAALGGFLFAFGMPRQDQICHQHLLPHAFAPFAAWYFWKLLHEPSRRAWLLLLVLTAWQLLASVHLGWFLMFSLGIWFLSVCWFDWGTIRRCCGFAREQRWFLLAASLIWMVGLWLFFRNYYIGNGTERREYSLCLYYMPYPTTWLACPPHTLWELHLAPGEKEHFVERHLGMGIGYALLLFTGLVVAWRKRHDPRSRSPALLALTSLITSFILILVTTNLSCGASIWFVINQIVPGADSIRAVGRICFSVMLLGVIGSLVIFQHSLIIYLKSPNVRYAISLLLLLICVGEHVRVSMPSFARSGFYPRTTALAKELKGADAAYVVLPTQEGDAGCTPDLVAMWAGLRSNVAIINGYSGRFPDNYMEFDNELEVEAVRILGQKWRGRLLIVEPGNPLRKRWFDVRLNDAGSQVVRPIETPGVD